MNPTLMQQSWYMMTSDLVIPSVGQCCIVKFLVKAKVKLIQAEILHRLNAQHRPCHMLMISQQLYVTWTSMVSKRYFGKEVNWRVWYCIQQWKSVENTYFSTSADWWVPKTLMFSYKTACYCMITTVSIEQTLLGEMKDNGLENHEPLSLEPWPSPVIFICLDQWSYT
jgi:hypothetical protein